MTSFITEFMVHLYSFISDIIFHFRNCIISQVPFIENTFSMPNPGIPVQLLLLVLECWGLLNKGEVGRSRYQAAKSATACSLVTTKCT